MCAKDNLITPRDSLLGQFPPQEALVMRERKRCRSASIYGDTGDVGTNTSVCYALGARTGVPARE